MNSPICYERTAGIEIDYCLQCRDSRSHEQGDPQRKKSSFEELFD